MIINSTNIVEELFRKRHGMVKRKFGGNNFDFKKISLSRLITGLGIGFFTIFFVYSFLTIFVEVFRIFQLGFNDSNGIIKFSPYRQYWNNVLSSGLAVVLGNSAFVLFCLSRPQRVFGNHSTKHKRIINDHIFLAFNFVYWFAKVAYFIGLMVSMFIDFEFIHQYYFVFVLLLVVLFLESWKTLGQVIKKNRLRAKILHFLILTIIALVLALHHPLDSRKINDLMEESNPTIELPVSEYENYEPIISYMTLKLFWDEGKYYVIYGRGDFRIGLDRYNDYLESIENEMYRKDFTTINLLAAKETPIKIVKKLEKILYINGYYRIKYVTKNNDKLVERYPKYGIATRIRIPDYLMPEFPMPPRLDMIYLEGLTKKTILVENGYTIGEQKNVGDKELKKVFERYIREDVYFELEYSKDLSYQEYMDVLSCYKQVILKKRKALEVLSDKGDCFDYSFNNEQFKLCKEEVKMIKRKFPFNYREVIID
ncbi:hypothetical protein [uncultured Aquimarina sp.]|uniref:hypothetical protein n=1 Tax=uncultured Aquimarina sp. TaxID=575652 RepID=UPI00263499AD|nr:hypothetical protein [uncultured Aquimarina sp.]